MDAAPYGRNQDLKFLHFNMFDRLNVPTDLLPFLQSIISHSLDSQYRVLSTACVLSYSAQEHHHYSLSTRQSWEKYFSVSQTPEWKLLFIFDRKKILNRIWQEAAANINIYSDWDLWYLQHGPAPGQNSFTRKKWEILFQDWQHSSQQGVLWELQTQFYRVAIYDP